MGFTVAVAFGASVAVGASTGFTVAVAFGASVAVGASVVSVGFALSAGSGASVSPGVAVGFGEAPGLNTTFGFSNIWVWVVRPAIPSWVSPLLAWNFRTAFRVFPP